MPSEKLPDLCYSHWLSFSWYEGQRENVDDVEGSPFQGAPFSQFHAKCLSPAAFQPCFVQRFLCFLLLEKLFMLMMPGRSEGPAVPVDVSPVSALAPWLCQRACTEQRRLRCRLECCPRRSLHRAVFLLGEDCPVLLRYLMDLFFQQTTVCHVIPFWDLGPFRIHGLESLRGESSQCS